MAMKEIPMTWIHRLSTMMDQEHIARRNKAAANRAEIARQALLRR